MIMRLLSLEGVRTSASRRYEERKRRSRVLVPLLPLLSGVVVLLAVGVSPAVAAGAPAWAVKSVALPTNFSTEDTEICEAEELCDAYVVTVTNVGSVTSNPGEPVVIKDILPTGVIAENYYYQEEHEPGVAAKNEAECERLKGLELSEVTCTYGGGVPPEGVVEVRFNVAVRQAAIEAGSVLNRVEVSGGGALPVVSSLPETVSNTVNSLATVPFGLQDFGAGVLGPEGAPDVQAGDHPSTLTTTMDYTTYLNKVDPGELLHFPAVAEVKTEIVDLPAGLIGNPTVLGTCAASAVEGTNPPGVVFITPKCPVDSRVGYVTVESQGSQSEIINLYNVPPEAGLPAEFGFEFDGTVVMLRPRLLPSSEGYVLSVSVPYLPRSQTIKVTGARVTFFGNPSERDGAGGGEAFFTDPTDCGASPLKTHVELDSWVDPADWVSGETPMFEASAGQGVTGCGSLRFEPSIQVTPETTTTDTPSGYEVVVKVPQAPAVPGVLATPDLKDAVVSLPEGVSVSPGAAYGLVGCKASGPEGIELGSNDLEFDENRVQEGEEEGSDGLVHPAAGHCPAASQIGTVEVETPVLPAHSLTGHVFVAEPLCGGAGQPACTPRSAEDGELFGIYLEVGSEASGIHVKLKGDVSVNPQTGQLTTRFTETPQVPFSELKLKLNGGARAPLASSQSCGTDTTTSDLTPWSTPYTPDATPSSSFPVTGCTGAFNPAFSAGTVASTAGAFSPFTLTFSRHDGEQDLSGLTVNMPEGLIGKIAGFAQCGAAEVAAAESNTGGCQAASKVGTATAAAGAGGSPFYQSGPVYLTGPYNGGPFGLAVVVPANAGPFHLGNIVVRAAIHINPTTAQVTVVSNPLPQMIDGVPLRVQTVNVTVGEGNDFTFNPTSCNPMAIGGTISSAQGASVGVSSPFQATGCAGLPFKPVVTVSTEGGSSKVDGASLLVRIAAKPGEANIAKSDLQIPLGLPARLQTLNKACLAATFEADPAGCPEGSFIGTATVHTPILNAALTGPVILVSHGGAAFPDVEIVLQGEGVEIVLDGKTDIKKGITYSNFEAVPDAPFSTFEASLGEGPHSIFTTEHPGQTNLCAPTKVVTSNKKETKKVHGKNRKVTVSVKKTVSATLVVPTKLVGQNGAVTTQNTNVSVTGCPKIKAAAKKKARASKAAKSSREGK